MPGPGCGSCLLHTGTKECRRHAPSPNHEEANLIVLWNTTRDDQRCSEYSEDEPWVPCSFCADWYRPAGGIKPGYMAGRPAEWWDRAGYCTKAAPGTTYREGMPTWWGVTHEFLGGCGSATDTREPVAEDGE